MTSQQSKDHGPVNEIENDFPIDLFANLATFHASPPHHAGGIAPGIKKAIAEQRQKAGVALSLRQKLAKQAAKRAPVEGHNGLQLLGEIDFSRPRIRQRDLLGHAGQIGVERNQALVRPPLVNGRFADPCTSCDRIGSDFAQRLALQQEEGCLQNGRLGGQAAMPPARLGLIGRFNWMGLRDLATPSGCRPIE
jgi:hypothetical protein